MLELLSPADAERSSPLGSPWRLAWNGFVAASPQSPFLQAWDWGEAQARFGAVPHRWAFIEGNRIRAAAQVLLERRGMARIATVQHGPVGEADGSAVTSLMDGIQRAYRGRALAVRWEPAWPDRSAARRMFIEHGMRPIAPVQPRSTLEIDLTVGEDELLAGFKQKWRYNIRLAQRKRVRVELGGRRDLCAFECLLAETAARHGLAARPSDYHAEVWDALQPDRARLYLARREGALLAAIMVVHFGAVATYLYGGSSEVDRACMPNHALQWHAMVEAKAAGCSHYDLWGIPDEIGAAVAAGEEAGSVPQDAGGLWGVWNFKRGFGGRVVRRVGRWEAGLVPGYRLLTGLARVVVRREPRAARS